MNDRGLHKRLLAAAGTTALALLGAGGAAAAQEAPQDESAADVGLEEIVVTAQRTSQRLQDVPVSVSALGGEDLERLQVNSLNDLTRIAPNVKFDTGTGGTGALKPYIRGGGATDGAVATSESEVAIYVDDVYRARLSGALVDFVELERIEVLRGPQGVLYGRNSSAGAVRLITRGPSSEFGGNLQVGYGTWNERRMRGYVTGGISDDGKWSASLNGMIRARDGGRQFNATLNKKVGAEDFQGAQADLGYEGDVVDARLSAFYTNSESDGLWAVSTRPDGQGDFTPYSGSYRRVLSPTQSDSGVEQRGTTLRTEIDYGGGTLTSITGFIKQDENWRVDFGGGVPVAGVVRALNDRTSVGGQKQFSQELQAAGTLFGGTVEYVTGVYYFHEKADQDIFTLTFSAPSRTRFDTKTDSFAGFGQLTWSFSDQLSVVAAGRYTIDDKGIDARLNTNSIRSRDSFERFTPKLGVNYKLNSDVLFYLSYGEGFKSGGYNGLASTLAQIGTAFRPQVTKAYEAGLKADFFDRRVRTNLAVFNNDITGRQQVVNQGNGGFIIENYDVRIRGIEAELSWRVIPPLTLWAQGALNDGKYTGVSAGGNGSLLGKEIPSLPDHQFTLGFDYSAELGRGELSFGSDYNVRDSFFSNADNGRIGRVPAQELLAAYVGYSLDNWEIRLSGKNLTQVSSWQGGFGFSTVQPRFIIEPRTWLLTAKYKF